MTHRQRRGGLSAHADKYAVAVHHAFLTGDGVPQADAGQPVPGKQRGNDAVPTEFHVFGLCQRLVIDLGGPQGVSAVDEDHFFRHAAEKEGICRGGIAAAHHDHRFALVKHPVAGGAVGHAPAQQLRLSGNAQRSGVCAGGQHHGFPPEDSLAGLHELGNRRQIHAEDFCVFAACPEALRLLLHLLRQREAIDPVLKAGIVVDLLGQGHLPTGGQFFQHDGVQPRPCRVQGGGVAARAAAHHEHIINMIVVHI